MKIVLKIFLILLLNSNIQAINEDVFVRLLKSYHPFFKQQLLNYKLTQVAKKATQVADNWSIISNVAYSKADDASMSNADIGLANISLTKQNLDSGSSIIFAMSGTNTEIGSINSASNEFSINYRRPLLRDKQGINSILGSDLADINIKISNLERREAEETFILVQLKKFIDLAYAQEQTKINQNRLDLAKQELKLIKQRYESSIADKVDVLLLEDAYQRAKLQLLQAELELTFLRNEIAILLGINVNKMFADFDLYKIHPISDKDFKKIIVNIRVLKIIGLRKEALKRQFASYKNQIKPKIDLNVGVVSKGTEDNYFTSISNDDNFILNVGLQLSYQFGISIADVNIETTQLNLANIKKQKEEQLLNVYTQVVTLKEQIGLFREILQSNKESIKIAREKTKEQRKEYINGNAEANFVLNAQNDEQNVKLDHARTARSYQKNILEFQASIDMLLP